MRGMDVFMVKNCTTSAPDNRKQPYVYEWSLIFLHKLLFGDIKLSDLEDRNRKLSAHDCTDNIKTLFSSDNYHETRNINMSQAESQAAMSLVPHHNGATLLDRTSPQSTWHTYRISAENNMAAWKRLTRIDRSLKISAGQKVKHLLANSLEVSILNQFLQTLKSTITTSFTSR